MDFTTSSVTCPALAALLTALACSTARAKVFETKTGAAAMTRLKRNVRYVMSLTEEEMLSIVPAQSGIYFTDCPNCEKGTQDRGPFKWAPERPREIVCGGCGEKYPQNPKYPDDKITEVTGPNGPHKYPYYERPDGKYRIYFRAHADYWAREYMANQCQYLAELYWTTKDEGYARRAALILLRFADVYPGYAYHMDLPFRQKRFSPWTRNRVKGASAYRTAKWSWWAYMDVSEPLVRAYDCLREWPGLAKMANGQAIERIENDLLGAMVDFSLGFRERYSNMSPIMWRRVIYAGRVLRRPTYVREAVRRFERFTRERFLHDGHWLETSPSYCSQVIGGLKAVANALKGYEYPEGYLKSNKGGRMGDAILREVSARVKDVAYSLYAPKLPNGRMLPVNDTWARSKRGARKTMEPVLMPGLGAAVMGGGEGEHQLHVHLNFTSGRGHKHKDALSFGLFAFDKELLPDIGYTHTKYRAWATSMMSHNTVVVNGRESGYDREHVGNRLRAFATDRRGFHVSEAESRTAYPDIVTRYRRTLFTIGTDSRDCYVVDVFQVKGGKQHDYLLHGSADEDSMATVTGAHMTPFDGTLMNPGVKFVLPKGESRGVGAEGAYGFVHDLSSGNAGDVVALDMRLTKSPAIGTRTLLLAEEGTAVHLGQAPSIRRSRRMDSTLDRYQAPFSCARRQGDDLESVFVAVHEPISGKPKIASASVERLADGVIVRIDRASRGIDYVVAALDDAAALDQPPLVFRGRFGMLRIKGDRVLEAHLVGGELLRFGSFDLTAEAGWRGEIRGVARMRGGDSRGYFDVAETIPADVSRLGRAVIVHHPDGTLHGYSVVRIEKTDGGSRLFVREDPGFKITADGSTKFLCHPLRTIKGTRHTYEMLNAVHVTAPK